MSHEFKTGQTVQWDTEAWKHKRENGKTGLWCSSCDVTQEFWYRYGSSPIQCEIKSEFLKSMLINNYYTHGNSINEANRLKFSSTQFQSIYSKWVLKLDFFFHFKTKQQASLEENQNLHYYASYCIVNINPLIRKYNQIGSGVANQQAITSFLLLKAAARLNQRQKVKLPKARLNSHFIWWLIFSKLTY